MVVSLVVKDSILIWAASHVKAAGIHQNHSFQSEMNPKCYVGVCIWLGDLDEKEYFFWDLYGNTYMWSSITLLPLWHYNSN